MASLEVSVADTYSASHVEACEGLQAGGPGNGSNTPSEHIPCGTATAVAVVCQKIHTQNAPSNGGPSLCTALS